MMIYSILEESAFEAHMPPWNEIVLSSDELGILPLHWKTVLTQWRGIYYIWDVSDGKGYLGSADGKDNILGRWEYYAASGHGENRPLENRNAINFRFGILQRVSPDMASEDVIHFENT